MTDRSDFDAMTPLEMARSLMQDHPASFKVGYSPENAARAAQSVYSLTDDATAELRTQLVAEHDLFEQLDDLSTRENSERLQAVEREWMVGVLVGQILGQVNGDPVAGVELAQQMHAIVAEASRANDSVAALWATAQRSLETLVKMAEGEDSLS